MNSRLCLFGKLVRTSCRSVLSHVIRLLAPGRTVVRFVALMFRRPLPGRQNSHLVQLVVREIRFFLVSSSFHAAQSRDSRNPPDLFLRNSEQMRYPRLRHEPRNSVSQYADTLPYVSRSFSDRLLCGVLTY